MGYKGVRADFEFLESVELIKDFVEIDAEMIPFMRNPTQAFAASLYQSAISLWFQQHGDAFDHIERVAAIREWHLL
jgi:hypothetical protein